MSENILEDLLEKLNSVADRILEFLVGKQPRVQEVKVWIPHRVVYIDRRFRRLSPSGPDCSRH